MPTKEQIKRRGGVVRVRTKKLPDGTRVRIFVFHKKGPNGGRTVGEKVGTPSGKTQRKGTGNTQGASAKSRSTRRTSSRS